MNNHFGDYASVDAVVVTYNPDINVLEKLLCSLLEQVSKIFIVDNSPNTQNCIMKNFIANTFSQKNVFLLSMGSNLGIAKALNVGIKSAISNGAQFILLSDQDSLPSNNMVSQLLQAHREISTYEHKIAAIGPTFIDTNTQLVNSFRVQLSNKYFYTLEKPSSDKPHLEVLTLITSGTLISVNALKKIGLMREDFFIDKVDLEWSLRAASKGYKLFGTGIASMQHTLGIAELRYWLFGWKKAHSYSPLRIYYQVRNLIAIIKLDYVSFAWKIRNTWFTLGNVYAHVFFGKEKTKTILMTIEAVKDGIIGKMNQYRL